MNRNLKTAIQFVGAASLLIVLSLAGCHKSSSSSGGPAGTSAARVMVGTMTKGSIIVNGVRFDDTTASIDEDNVAIAPADLGDGMLVKVKGTVNADGITGTAEKVEVESEVRGTIVTRGTDTMTVNGQIILVDGGTVIAGAAATAVDLTAGTIIEVHGERDATGMIHASRIEKLTAAGDNEVRGKILSKSATNITIGSLSIAFDNATTMVPAGATIDVGDIVEVDLDASGTRAAQISVEHLAESEFEAAEGQELSIEGFVNNFTDLTTDFLVSGQIVHAADGVRFEGGLSTDLANGMKVEAEGQITGGKLIAEKISFRDNIRFETNAGADGSTDCFGKTVQTTSVTEFSNLPGGAASIASGDGLRIRGKVNIDGTTVTAQRIEKLSSPIQADRSILQGPVSSVAGKSLVIMGITIDASGVASVDSLLSQISVNRTVVKARGTFASGVITANEIEIE